MTWRTSPERRAEMVVEWKAQRLVWVELAGRAKGEIRCLDEMIEKFGEGSNGKAA